MKRTATRLLAAATAGAALLGITTAPAHAAVPREATATPYAFIGSGGDQEAVTIENQLWRVPDHTLGRTQAHPGWSIHLSDERLGAGLPRQNIRGYAKQGESYETHADTSGFISIIDQNQYDVPFLVFKLGGENVVCEGFVGYTTPRLFVRKFGELYEADVTKPAVSDYVTGAGSATDPQTYSVTVEVKRITSPTQVTPYGPFAKYADRERVRADGHEITLTHRDITTGGTKTYRLLAGAQAVSC